MIDIATYEASLSTLLTQPRRNAAPTQITTSTGVLAGRTYYKRDSKSSSSTTTKNKSTKCTGSKEQCQLPSNNTHSTAVTVGVAVAVPVFVVILALAVILLGVYRRSKREAKEDLDPDFEGETEFLPNVHPMYPMPQQQQQQQRNMAPQRPPQNYYTQPQPQQPMNPFSNNAATNSTTSWNVDPFQLPQGEDVSSLRNFARQVTNDGLGGYQIASRNVSQVSLTQSQANLSESNVDAPHSFHKAQLQGHEIDSSSSGSPNDVLNEKITSNSQVNVATGNDMNQIDSNNNKESGIARLHRESKIQGDAFEFEFENEQEKGKEKHVRQTTNPVNEDEDDYVVPVSSDEDENIKRMKSIYQVYLDRDGTMKQKRIENSEGDDDEFAQEHERNISQEPVQNPIIKPNQQIPHLVINDNQQPLTENPQPDLPEGTNLAIPDRRTRIASSIYSEAPINYQQQQQYYPQQQQPMAQQPYVQYPPQASL